LASLAFDKNYHSFFKAYSNLSPLEAKLLTLTGFLEELRFGSFKVILTAYRASGFLELPHVLASLGLKDLTEFSNFCERKKVQLVLSEARDCVDLKKTR
jgi:hypothetical protein